MPLGFGVLNTNEVSISKLVPVKCFNLASLHGEETLQNISKLCSIPLIINGFSSLEELLSYVVIFSMML